jgi:endonuclease/exonuclease/phosphatase family metal-dependent hydrolase
MGGSYDTTMTMEEYEEKLPKYRSTINEANADIICLCEYNKEMVKVDGGDDILAKDAIFPIYPYYNENSRPSASNYNWDAMFSRFPLKNVTRKYFATTLQAGRYMLIATITMNGKDVKVVATHLDWGGEGSGLEERAAQMAEMVSEFANDDYVILCADYNTSTASEYDVFVNAGYTMANHEYLGAIVTSTKTAAIDNIIVKGFVIGDVKVFDKYNPDIDQPPYGRELSDHSSLVCELTMLNNIE